jgi:hypothetical protein
MRGNRISMYTKYMDARTNPATAWVKFDFFGNSNIEVWEGIDMCIIIAYFWIFAN